MKNFEKEEMYDELCRLLTDYEMYGEDGHTHFVEEYELYEMLVKIQNNWWELISEED